MLKKILITAFLLRIIMAFLGQHGDVINYYWWSKDLLANGLLGFYDRNIANAVRPTYPPVTSYLFLFSAYLHEIVYKISWFLNLYIDLFPSNLIFWLESERGWYVFNKLPAILADVGIIYLLYLFVRELKNKKAAILASLLFSFTPVFWYNSSLWGQTDSIFALPMLAGFYALYKKKIKLSIFLFGLSVLTKPTVFFVMPVVIFWLIKTAKFKDIFIGILIFLGEVVLLYFPFHPENLVSWIVTFYKQSLGGELGYIAANAFNFWTLIFGFDNKPDTSLFFGFPANLVGSIVFIIFALVLGFLFFKKKKLDISLILMTAVIMSFAAFMFLPRMHDRYFYPTLVMLVPLAATNKKLRNVFWVASTIHLINLYHFWWVPKFQLLVNILSNNLVEKTLIVFNIAVFIYIIRVFINNYHKAG